MFANCSLPGMDMAFPDVCKTPSVSGTITLPYPNTAMKTTALVPTAFLKHLLLFMPAHNMGTTNATTMGDNAGVMGGVSSGIFMGPARNTKGSLKVLSGGMPATRMLDPTMQNLSNAMGVTLVPGQFKVVYLT